MSQSNVRDRRLRHIYEWLDNGNNKKVLPEVDRVLKKQPGLTCAKVLKAMALIRMNKPADAREILDPIVEDIPTDDDTIQALSVCYRELEDPVTMCRVLEVACKKDQSEELLTLCFMAQARICEYHKQHLTAMTLYKLYNKATYFGWAIASMLLKAKGLAGSEANVRMVTLQVAERMLLKFTTEAKNTVNWNIMYLYFEILSLQEKWSELLHIMELHGYPQPKFNNDHVHELYCHALIYVNKREELFGYLKDMFMQRMDEIHILTQMVSLFGQTNLDWVVEFFNTIRIKYPSRIIGIADLDLTMLMSSDEAFPRVAEDLNMICDYGVEKPSMFEDVECFLNCLVTEESKQNFLQRVKLPNDDKEDSIPKYESAGKVIRDVNYELVDRMIYPDLDPVARMRRAHRCVRKYLQAEIDMATFHTELNLKIKESDNHDQFLVIAATTLLTKYDESEHDFDGVVETVLSLNDPWSHSNDLNVSEELKEFLKMDNLPVPDTHNSNEGKPKVCCNSSNGELENQLEKLDLDEDKNDSSEGGSNYFEDEPQMKTDVTSWNNSLKRYELQSSLKTDQPYVLHDEEYLLMTALNLMEYGLQRSPRNPYLRILLARAYIRVGAVRRALTILQGLDLKHVQWDSLGYLFLPWLISGGLFAHALGTLTVAESFYTCYKRECMEHIITAYKCGNFSKIQEFTSFRDMLINSVQYGVVSVEKKMLEYVMAITAPELQVIAEKAEKEMEQDLAFAHLTQYADNRDFTVIPLGDSNSNRLEGTKINTYLADLLQYRLKHGVLLLITKMVLLTAPNGPGITPENTTQIGECLKNFKIAARNVKTYSMDIQNSKYLYGIWPHKITRCKDLDCFESLVNQFECVVKLMKPDIESKQPILASLARMISDDVNVQLQQLNINLQSLTLLTVGQAIEGTQCMLEALSISRIIFWVCLILIKDMHEKPTVKKKKCCNEEVKKEYASAVQVMGTTVYAVLVYFAQFEIAMQNLGPFKWTEAEEDWGNSIGWCFRNHIFPKNFDNIQKYICESHFIQMMEMKHVAVNMIAFFKSLV